MLFLLGIPGGALAAIPYRVTVVDPNSELGSRLQPLLDNLDAAIKDWSRFIQSKGELWLEIDVTETTTNGRFAGGSTGSPLSVVTVIESGRNSAS